jgi:hypothetical protein
MSGPVHADEATSSVFDSSREAQRILFASAHSIVDFSNGASVATLGVLHGLCASGFECRAFCTPRLDLQKGTRLEHVLDDSRERTDKKEIRRTDKDKKDKKDMHRIRRTCTVCVSKIIDAKSADSDQLI